MWYNTGVWDLEKVISSFFASVFSLVKWEAYSAHFGITYTKIETIHRRLTWPLHKDDTKQYLFLKQYLFCKNKEK